MKPIKKILVAVGNESSLNRCLNVAIPIAKGIGASITGIYVLAPYPRNLYVALEQRWRKHEKENAEKYLEIAKEKCKENGIEFVLSSLIWKFSRNKVLRLSLLFKKLGIF